jgi:hypothetical protein
MVKFSGLARVANAGGNATARHGSACGLLRGVAGATTTVSSSALAGTTSQVDVAGARSHPWAQKVPRVS